MKEFGRLFSLASWRLGGFFFGLLLASSAHAGDSRPEEPNESQQRVESRTAFRRGVAALQSQRWDEAKAEFVHAYELFPHPSILLDLGVARTHVGEDVEAERDLTRFLAEDTTATPDELQTARTALEGLRKRLGTLRVRVSPRGALATLDDKPIALVSGELVAIRVTLGSHKLEASAPEHVTWSNRVDVDPSDAKVIDLTLAEHHEPPPPTPLGTQRIVSIVLISAGAFGAGFGIFAAIHSLDLAEQYNTPTEQNYQNPGTKSDGIAYRTVSDVTFAISGACVAAGIILYFTAPNLLPHLALTPSGLGIRF